MNWTGINGAECNSFTDEREAERNRGRGAERNPFDETPCPPINYNGILTRLIATGAINCAALFYQARAEDTSKVKGKIISAGGLGCFFSNGIRLPGLASPPEKDPLTTNRFYDHVLSPGGYFATPGTISMVGHCFVRGIYVNHCAAKPLSLNRKEFPFLAPRDV